MWNSALIFSNKNRGQKKTLYRNKKSFAVDYAKNYILYTQTSHAIWVDEIANVMIPIKRSIKTKTFWKNSFLNKFYMIFHFLSLWVFILIQDIGRSIPLSRVPSCKTLSNAFDMSKQITLTSREGFASKV